MLQTMLDYLRYFFDPSHLFAIQPPVIQTRAIMILAVLFGLLLVASLVCSIVAPRLDSLKAKGFKRLMHLGLTMGILGYLYLFFAWQRAALLGARFWLVIWLAVTLVWVFFIVKYLVLVVPAKRMEIDQRRRFEKYLP